MTESMTVPRYCPNCGTAFVAASVQVLVEPETAADAFGVYDCYCAGCGWSGQIASSHRLQEERDNELAMRSRTATERDQLRQQVGALRADLDTAAALVPDYRRRRDRIRAAEPSQERKPEPTSGE